jgi:hypothetical protein
MVSGEIISLSALVALGNTGGYRPRPLAHDRKEAVQQAAMFLLSGFSNPNARNPAYNILENLGNHTFKRR